MSRETLRIYIAILCLTWISVGNVLVYYLLTH